MKYVLIILVLLSLSLTISHAQTSKVNQTIEGTIKLDSIWNPKIYLSLIPEFSKMYTMSKSMIIAESKIDSSGYFKFNLGFLPKNDNLYRIHVSKKGSSEASIIIGGKDENHFFVIANNSSNILVNNRNRRFNDISVINDDKNKILRKIDDIVRYIDSTNYISTRIKSEFVTNAFNEQLRQIADTCSYPLVSLYALQKSSYENDIMNNTAYYQKFSEKWDNQNSIYFKSFREKIPKQKGKTSSIILIPLIALISFFIGLFLNRLLKQNITKEINPIKDLSVQERRIFSLLKDGKSNKEISEKLNIGVSTTKSHVSNIYSKLNVNSRKDILNFKEEVK
ncbi:LuxR C-terminal-related transcriptional regulator [Psychroserpens sp. AS72]|uniref:helix-turn-helix domain-containing protein n=1 Tax=Psychroserpens sp. AS72 TaxID=3135775 RepID=UPI003172D4CA